MGTERVRARVFGEVAGEYDRIRPGYPQALIDEVLDYARLGDRPALEVGAGTGKATTAFADRGVTVTAVEPDQAMAAVLAGRLSDRPRVTISVCPFEELPLDRQFGLLYSAQAWHWIDPAVRWQRAADALAPGGTLALFWNDDRLADRVLSEKVRAVHETHAPDVVTANMAYTVTSVASTLPELTGLPTFGEVSTRLYHSRRDLTPTDYLAFLSTQSAYRVLDESVRAVVFDAVRRVLPADRVTLEIRTVLHLGRRLP